MQYLSILSYPVTYPIPSFPILLLSTNAKDVFYTVSLLMFIDEEKIHQTTVLFVFWQINQLCHVVLLHEDIFSQITRGFLTGYHEANEIHCFCLGLLVAEIFLTRWPPCEKTAEFLSINAHAFSIAHRLTEILPLCTTYLVLSIKQQRTSEISVALWPVDQNR